MIRQTNGTIRLEATDLTPDPAHDAAREIRAAYRELRFAADPYPVDLPTYDAALEYSLKDPRLPREVSADELWVLRGAAHKAASSQRLSINALPSPGLLNAIDDWILNQKVSANYKFPAPRLVHELFNRHDPVTIFLPDNVSRADLQSLASRVASFTRGDSLIGDPIIPGVRLTIATPAAHIQRLASDLENIDSALAGGIRRFAHRCFEGPSGERIRDCPPGIHAAIERVLESRGIASSYDKSTGFSVSI